MGGGRILGLDIGSVRIGVAVSCPLRLIAQPLEVIHRRQTAVAARLAHLVATYQVEHIVVGRPLQLDGAAGAAVHAATRCMEDLCAPGGPLPPDIAITWWDERLTTAQAQRAMISAGARRQQRRQTIDKVAAAILLQSYLDAAPPA